MISVSRQATSVSTATDGTDATRPTGRSPHACVTASARASPYESASPDGCAFVCIRACVFVRACVRACVFSYVCLSACVGTCVRKFASRALQRLDV